MSQLFQNLYRQVYQPFNAGTTTTSTGSNTIIIPQSFNATATSRNKFAHPRDVALSTEVWGNIEKISYNISRRIDKLLFNNMFKFKNIKLKRVIIMNEIRMQIKYGFLPWRPAEYFCIKIEQLGNPSYYGNGIGPEEPKQIPTIEQETQQIFKQIIDAYLNVKKNRYIELDEINLNKDEDLFRLKL